MTSPNPTLTMTEASPPPPPQPPKRAATFTSSSQPYDRGDSLHARVPRRKSSGQSLSSSHSHSRSPRPIDRRASTFSLSSIDELTSDLINPSFTRQRQGEEQEGEDEVTNWHSTPLLFALLPAVGGVLFKEGAAVVTDLLILGLAAIFLNWSVRLPWDWYYAAQVLVRREEVRLADDGIDGEEEALEDGDERDGDVREEGTATASSTDSAPNNQAPKMDRTAAVTERHELALRDLLRQQTYALISTFIFPALAAYLLHILRFQLSKPSTGLVSDYNLSIFLLVAEIRPCRHLIRLIKKRTLHLQRTILDSDEAFSASSKTNVAGLTARIDELEQRLAQQQQTSGETLNGHVAKKSLVDELSLEMKKRYESRIDALERAVRRYEKRTTTLAMVTEQRLKTLDGRLESTLSLAAVAAQQSRQRSTAGRLMDLLVAATLVPLQLLAFVVMWPVRMLENAYDRLMGLLLGPRRTSGKGGGKRGDAMKSPEKGRERYSGRKPDVSR